MTSSPDKTGDQLQADSPESPLSLSRRKPVPTPRSTLKKTAAATRMSGKTTAVYIVKGDGARASANADMDSQGRTSESETSSSSPQDQDHSSMITDISRNSSTGEDILAALEKVPGVGSLRSLASPSVTAAEFGPGVPSSNFTTLGSHCRIKRDDQSSHSLGSSIAGVGQRRLLGQATKNFQKRYNHHTLGPKGSTPPPLQGNAGPLFSSSFSSDSGAAERLIDEELQLGVIGKSVRTRLENETSMNSSIMHDRPLPDIPDKKEPEKEDEEELVDEIKTAGGEDIYSSLLSSPTEDHYCELTPRSVENSKESNRRCKKVAAAQGTDTSSTFDTSTQSFKTRIVPDPSPPTLKLMGDQKGNGSNNYLTMTGTIKRGRFQERTVDIRLDLSPDDLEVIEKRVHDKFHDRCFCGLWRGPHVFILSILALPLLWPYFTIQTFFLGSMTWFNIFTHYNEERSCCHKLLSPLVLLAYPFWIAPVTLFLGLFGAFSQISWYWDSWIQQIQNPDSGFLGWACAFVNLPDCCPYQTVLLDALQDESLSNLCHSPANRKPVPI